MAYEKHEWQTGEVITAEKLNNLEDGCGNSGGTLIVTFTPNSENSQEGTSDKSADEIVEALNAGKVVLGTFREGSQETNYMNMFAPLSMVANHEGTSFVAFTFTIVNQTDTVQYIAVTLSGNSYQSITKSVNVASQN